MWLWVFCVCTGLVCVLGWFFGLGCFLGFVSLWCEGYCVHKHVDFAGCGCVSMLSFLLMARAVGFVVIVCFA